MGMSKPLKNPDLPPGAIVETDPDGGARRNDGVRLTPASQNPWYVLATVAGEQEGSSLFGIDDDLHAKNRRFWNGWMCQEMGKVVRDALAEKLGLPRSALDPLSAEQLKELRRQLESKGLKYPPPKPGISVDFKSLHFTKGFWFSGFIVPSSILFDEAHFAQTADFRGAHFRETAYLRDTHFESTADFVGAFFNAPANFSRAYFNAYAWFENARFESITEFEETEFKAAVNFSGGVFGSKTSFSGAKFEGRVPTFFHREMNQDTKFSEDKTLWPEPKGKGEKFLDDGKRAYTRLRQVAAEIYDPDLEHFFLRQEMKCKEALAGRFEKVLFILYRKFADSGISVKRPAAALAGLWGLGAAMFAGYFLAPMGHHVPDYVAASPGWSGIGLSFANVFAFLGLSRAFFAEVLVALPISLKYFAGLQTVLGAVFFFLLALGLRNRFRLK